MTATKQLKGRIAVVAGATRGAGRGIARALGEAGATVYCTGRSVRGNPSPYGRPETIDETAEMIQAAGGDAIAVRVDHTVESEVEQFFARIDRELRSASFYLLLCGVLTFFGVIHSALPEGNLYLPWALPDLARRIPYQFTAAYFVLALVFLALSFTKESRQAAE